MPFAGSSLLAGTLGLVASQMVSPDHCGQIQLDEVIEEYIELTLECAVELGLQRSFGTQRAARNLQISELNVDSAKARNRPQVDSSLRIGQTQNYREFRGSAFRFSDVEPDFNAALIASGSLPLDLWNVTARGIQQAEYSRELSSLSLEQLKIATITRIKGQYLSAWRARYLEKVAVDNFARLASLIDRAADRQPDAVDFLRSEREVAIQQLENANNDTRLSLSLLQESLRLPSGIEIKLVEADLPQETLPSQPILEQIAEQSRSDLRQATVRLEQARLRRIQASDSRRPSLNLTAYANQGLTGRTPFLGDEDAGRSLAMGVSLDFRLPLVRIDGGSLSNQRRIADIQAEQALADYQEALERMGNEVERALIGIDRTEALLRNQPNIKLARAALAEAESRFLQASADSWSTLLPQVTNARDNLRRAEEAVVRAKVDHALNILRLYQALGLESRASNRISSRVP